MLNPERTAQLKEEVASVQRHWQKVNEEHGTSIRGHVVLFTDELDALLAECQQGWSAEVSEQDRIAKLEEAVGKLAEIMRVLCFDKIGTAHFESYWLPRMGELSRIAAELTKQTGDQ